MPDLRSALAAVCLRAAHPPKSRIVVNLSLDNILVGSPSKSMSVLAPVLLDQLEQSVTTLIDDGHDVLELDQSLEEWRSLVRESKAGYFTTSLSAIAEMIASQRK
jgi:hypothetical protein